MKIDRRFDRQVRLRRRDDRSIGVEVEVEVGVELEPTVGNEAALLQVSAVQDGLGVFCKVDEEGDGAVQGRQEVGQVRQGLQPARPGHVFFTDLEKKLIDRNAIVRKIDRNTIVRKFDRNYPRDYYYLL